ncbi:MAG: hypothetical protein LAP61_03255 [Acidobacteriia bacterium]|nr:hypothetical protein [Terriglobia bacterium]
MGMPLNRNQRDAPHPSDELLEDYALCRLPEALAAPIEEHLLICHCCQDAVAATDEFAAALKCAPRRSASRWSVLRKLPRLSAGSMTLAPAFVLSLGAFLSVWNHAAHEPSAPFAVNLTSMRGLSPLASAPAGKPLRLSIGLPDLVSTGEYRVEMVDAAGSPVWKGAASDIDGELVATISQPLGKGVYWIRLYGQHAELLREFGLSAK